MRYGAGIVKWNKEELQAIDRKTRKVMAMNKELHPRSDVARVYVTRKKGGRALISLFHISYFIFNSFKEGCPSTS